MDLKSLHAFWLFYLVAREKSFTKAAAIANMSQPPLSMQIQNLEAKLGKQLIDRSFRKLTLTKEGKRLFPLVENFLNQTDDFFSEVQASLAGKRGKILIGTFSWAIHLFAVPIILKLSKKFSNDRFDFLEIESINVPNLLKDKKLDIGYAYAEPFENSGLVTETIAEIECVCVVSNEHPLANYEQIRMKQLKGEDCVCIASDVSPDLYRIMSTLARKWGFEIKTNHSIRNYFAQSAHVGLGRGFALLPRPATESLPETLTKISISNGPSLKFMRICRKGLYEEIVDDLRPLEKKHLEVLQGVHLTS